MIIKRRQFIQVGSLATASFLVPKFLKAFEGNAMVPAGNKVVVILQLSGGNDGLNTVIPVRTIAFPSNAFKNLGTKKDAVAREPACINCLRFISIICPDFCSYP